MASSGPSGQATEFHLVAKADGDKKARIEVFGDIYSFDGENYNWQIRQLINAGQTDIDIYINSPGGNLVAAQEIVNLIQKFPGKKRALLGALVASSATIIACACDERIASTNTLWMVHDPSWTTTLQNSERAGQVGKSYDTIRQSIVDAYVKATGLSEDSASEMMRRETWLNAEQAKSFGFVTSITDHAVTAFAGHDIQMTAPDAPAWVLAQLSLCASDPLNTIKQGDKTPLLPNNNATNFSMSLKIIALQLGLPETATQEQVTAAISALQAAKAPDADTAALRASVTDAINALAKAKGIDPEAFAGLAKAAPVEALKFVTAAKAAAPETEDDEEAAAIVEARSKTTPDTKRVADVFAEASGKSAKSTNAQADRADWDYPRWTKEDPTGLNNLAKTAFTAYAKLYENYTGKAPAKADVEAMIGTKCLG